MKKRLRTKVAVLAERVKMMQVIQKMEIKHLRELESVAKSDAKEALLEAKEATKIHFASVNEFGDRMKTVVDEQASREWANEHEKANDIRFNVLETFMKTKTGQEQGVSLAVKLLIGFLTLISLILGIIVFIQANFYKIAE